MVVLPFSLSSLMKGGMYGVLICIWDLSTKSRSFGTVCSIESLIVNPTFLSSFKVFNNPLPTVVENRANTTRKRSTHVERLHLLACSEHHIVLYPRNWEWQSTPTNQENIRSFLDLFCSVMFVVFWTLVVLDTKKRRDRKKIENRRCKNIVICVSN